MPFEEPSRITMPAIQSLLLVSPDMVGRLVNRVRASEKRELHIPAEAILPRGYAQYLLWVLEANSCQEPFDNRQKNQFREPSVCGQGNQEPKERQGAGIRSVYCRVAGQIETLEVNQQKCFDSVDLSAYPWNPQFNLNTSQVFYQLAKERSLFTYIQESIYGTEEIMLC